MNTERHSKKIVGLGTVLALGFSFAASLAHAGPPPQFWNRPSARPAVTEPAKPVAPSDNSGLKCSRMQVPLVGVSKPGVAPQLRSTTVICTPELMKSDRRCQQACATASQTLPAKT